MAEDKTAPRSRPDLHALNAFPRAAFVQYLATIWEDSAWVADRTWDHRPFDNLAALHKCMTDTVQVAGKTAQLALLRAHPDLAGKLTRGGGLTAHSTEEQAGLGLDRLEETEFAWFDRHNAAYRARFGFPFIIAVKENTRDGIRHALATRLDNDPAVEMKTALGEVAKIAKFRLEGLFGT
ncbi:2-oxo-4-hydroxy-4-carboxy-5-ureidoimidazoline decarboxylase [Niveispirillum fermenti]|uniref:2-oxo-4-hydroxy-4-carboxy-5-ureidoimidazoline decarboxylase n=1 Tax=Niveispirillum fermenti TaxID=1233113 RepID=UPI003A83EF92